MTIQKLTAQLVARREADTVDSEPRADYNNRLQQLNYNFLSLRERIEAKDNELLHLAAGYATTEEWKQLESTYKLEAEPNDELFAELESLPAQFANLVNEDAVRHTAETDPATFDKLAKAFGIR